MQDVESSAPSSVRTIDIINRKLNKRYRAEKRFKRLGLAAILSSLLFLALLFISIASQGYSAFVQTYILLDIHFSRDVFDVGNLAGADYNGLVRKSLQSLFPEVRGRQEKRMLNGLISSGASFQLQKMVMSDTSIIGSTRSVWVPADDDVDMLMKGRIDRSAPEAERRLKDVQLGWIDGLRGDHRLQKKFNMIFFTGGDSREPELAGILGATMGSMYTLIVTLLLSFPVGVASAIYLEEFAPRNKWIDLIEVNINNLAAVPSIVFGLLGLAVFLNFFGLPRSAPLVGGLVLTLMTLPTIIIASRVSIQSVPPSIREAALGVGASKMQTVFHHVMPLALPGMVTGTIIGMARALGESARLLMIGMVAFIVDPPGG
ncbi:MAG: PstA family ABC transporter permease, partial [Desulfobulbaceae bacterium]|nr:PstA family ABC transporter permease [Desulfobulbaceae bacterium]